MVVKTDKEIGSDTKTNLNIRPGDTVKVHQIIKEKTKKTKGKGAEIKERIQIFEGIVLARKHGNEIGATITVRKVIDDVGVERIFPIHSPKIQKIEVIKRSKVRRSKLYYLRALKSKKAKLKKIEIKPPISSKKSSLELEKFLENSSNNKNTVKQNKKA